MRGTGVDAFQQFVREDESTIDLDELDARRLDASKLTTVTDVDDAKVYFIDEQGRRI